MSEELRADRKVVLAAVNSNGLALLYASKELRADRTVVLAAVNNNGSALQRASAELRSDPEVILSATKNNPKSLKFATGDLIRCTTGESIAFMETVMQTVAEGSEGGPFGHYTQRMTTTCPN